MAAVTRLGLYGGTRGLYGSFAGKTEQEIVEVAAQPTGGWSVDPYGYETRRRARLREDREAEEQAQEAIARAQAAARDALDAKAGLRTERATANARLAREEVSRLVDELQAQLQQNRRRKMAAVLLLM